VPRRFDAPGQWLEASVRAPRRRPLHRRSAGQGAACIKLVPVIDPRLIDDLARRLGGTLPESLRSLREDLEQNFKATLQSALGRLDLVTREEFDLRTAMLERAREQLAALERRLDALEQRKD
jgi:hypothetical protein